MNTVNVGSTAPNTGGDVNGIAGRLVIHGQSGSDTLNVYDKEDGAETGNLTATEITGLDLGTGISYNDATDKVETLNIFLGARADTFNILSTDAATTTTLHSAGGDDIVNVRTISGTTTVNGGDGADSVNVGSNAAGTVGNANNNAGGTVDLIGASLTVNGNGAADVLNVDDASDGNANTGTLTSTTITGLDMGGSITYGTIETLNIGLGTAGDVFTIQSTHAGVTNLNANNGADIVNVRTIGGITTVNGGDGSDTFNVGSNAQGSTGMPGNNAGGIVDGIGALLTINGNDPDHGSDVLNVDDTQDSNDNTGALTSTTINGLDMGGSITYGSIEHLTISLGSGADTFTINSTHGAATIASVQLEETTLNTGAGTDTVNINDVTDLLYVNGEGDADTINVFGTGAGSVATLSGDGGNDIFNIQAMDGVVNVRGGADNDTVNVTDVAPTLPTGPRTTPTGSIDEINALLDVDGGNGVDLMNVDDSRAAQSNDKIGTLTGNTLRGLELDVGIDYLRLEQLNIWLGYGDNTFDVNGTHAGETTVNTAQGEDTININDASGQLTVNAEQQNDVINVRATSLNSVVRINSQEDEDIINLSDVSPTLPVPYPAIQTPPAADPVGIIDAINGLVVINGGSQFDTINIDDSRNASAKAGALTSSTLRGLELEAGVDYSEAEDLNIWLGTGTDTFYVASTHAGTTQLYAGDGNATTNQRDDTIAVNTISGVTTIHGQGGNDGILANVKYDGGVPPLVGIDAANDAQFARTHGNGLHAVLNLHGEGGTDLYIINLAGSGNAEINVLDNGLPNDGADRLVVNGADTVNGLVNNPDDTFLLRKDMVALLNAPDVNGAFTNIERINYDQNINARLTVNSLGGNDKLVIDDNSSITALDGGDGDDTFQVGQVFGTLRDANAGLAERDQFATLTPVIIGLIRNPETGAVIFDPSHFDPVVDSLDEATRQTILAAIAHQTALGEALDGVAYVSKGATYSLTAFGGDGADIFNIYRNEGTLRLEGENDNDTFVVRAFVAIDLSVQGDTEVAGGGGSDTIQYAVNAPISIDGGSGFDKVVVLGTPFNDTFVVTAEGIFGAGLNVKFDNVESAEIDALEGSDTIYILGTSPKIVTTVIGGMGDDTIEVMGDVTKPVVSNDLLGRAGLITQGLTSTDLNYDHVGANGVGFNVLSAADAFLIDIHPTGEPLLVSEEGDIASYFIGLLSPNDVSITNPVYLTVSAGLASSQDSKDGGESLLVRVKGSGDAFTEALVLTFDGTVQEFEIEVMAVDDVSEEGPRTAIISHSVISNNAPYAEQVLLDIFVDIVDNDLPAIDVRSLGSADATDLDGRAYVLEGVNGIQDYYSIALTAAPNAGETVRVTVNTDAQLDTNVTTLTFDSTNWSTAQVVSVSATDDPVLDGVEFSTITHSVASTGGKYSNVTTIDSIEFVVYDDETPGALVEQTNGSTIISTDGTTDTYRVRLTAAPAAGTTVTLTVVSDGQAILSGTGVTPVAGTDEYTITFDSTNWSDWVTVTLTANQAFTSDLGPRKIFPPIDQNLNQIRGPLIIEGGVGNGEDRTLAEPILLPGETNDVSEQEANDTTEADGVDVLNIYHTDNADADVGKLFYRDTDSQGRPIQNGGLALTGFEMGGDFEVDQGTRTQPDIVHFGGGITINGFEQVELLLGKGNETLTVETTADRDEVSDTEVDHPAIWAIHGGGGSDTITLNGRGEGALVVYGDTSEDGVRYSNDQAAASIDGTYFNNPGDDIINASGMPENNDDFTGVAVYGGPGNDTITGSQDDDQLAGGTGIDWIYGQQGNDHIYGDSSFNVNLALFAQDQNAAFDATTSEGLAAINAMFTVPVGALPGVDHLFGDDGDDIILGDHGVISQDDGTRRIQTTDAIERIESVVEHLGGADIISGNVGNDIIIGGDEGDTIHGDSGDNIILGDHGVIDYVIDDGDRSDIDRIFSMSTTTNGGADVIDSGTGDGIIIGGRFGDTIDSLGGNNVVIGDSGAITAAHANGPQFGNQPLTIGRVETNTFGDGGIDIINTGTVANGNDIVLGGHEGDTINVREGDNLVIGDDGAVDYARFERDGSVPGADTDPADIDLVISVSTTAFGGADDIDTGTGDDIIIGGRYGDTIDSLGGNNIVIGDSGAITAANANGPQFGSQPLTIGRVETNTFGDGGIDIINTGTLTDGRDIVLGGHEGDTINVREGDNLVIGDDGAVDYARFERDGSVPGADTDPADIDLVISLSTTAFGGADDIDTGTGDDIIIGGRYGDTIDSLGGNNIVIGDSGMITAANDDSSRFGNQPLTVGRIETITFGDGGVDTINTGTESDGNDIVLGGHLGDTINVHEGDNIVLGDDGAIDYVRTERDGTVPGADTDASDIDLIVSLSTTAAGGVDDIDTGNGDDIIIAGRDNDTVDVLGGNNIVIGDSGIITAADDNTSRFGNQLLTVGLIETTTFGDGGIDTVDTGAGNDIVLGGHDGDILHVSEGNNIVLGDDGTITYAGLDFDGANAGDDTDASDIDEIVSTSTTQYGGVDAITSGAGQDIIIGGRYGDTINAGDGDNLVIGDSGQIRAAGAGTAQLAGLALTLGRIETTTFGDGGIDTVDTGAGNDIVLGGHDSDILRVSGGNNIVLGDDGAITYTGLDFDGTSAGDDTDASDIDEIVSTSTALYGGIDTVTSGAGQDIIIGGRYADTINAGDGDNLVIGDSGQIRAAGAGTAQLAGLALTLGRIETTTFGDGGIDTVDTGAGNDIVLGGHDSDILRVSGGNNIVLGDDGAISYTGASFGGTSAGDDTDAADIDEIVSTSTALYGGVDAITSGAGQDIIIGGRYGDTINAGDGNNLVIGDSGQIRAAGAGTAQLAGLALTLGRIETTTFGDGGIDTVDTGAGNDIVLGGHDSDILRVSGGNNIVLGDDGAISYTGASFSGASAGDDTDAADIDEIVSTSTALYGGVDTVTSGAGQDIIIGGRYADTINAGDGNNLVIGDSGQIRAAGAGTAQLAGLALTLGRIETTEYADGGEDSITTGAGKDMILGGAGGDAIGAGADIDMVHGDNALLSYVADANSATLDVIDTLANSIGGADTIRGEAGEDILIGGAYGDRIDGGSERDLIFGDNVKLDRTLGDGTANARYRTLSGAEGGQIYSTATATDGLALVTADSRNIPGGAPVWEDFNILILDHDATTEAAAGSNFGDDYIAGGAGNDQIFGQLGNDTLQGDGSIDLVVGAQRLGDGTLSVQPSVEASTDGDDYIEGNGGNDIIFGNLGQDDLIGGSSSLFSLTTADQRTDATGADTIFGGAGSDLARNNTGDAGAAAANTVHARDADMILGDNGNIYRLVSAATSVYLEFGYDQTSAFEDRGTLRIIPRAAELLDYTPGGPDFNATAAALDIGVADEIHGESGDDFIYGMVGNDVLFGEGQDDDLIGGWGKDWISGGTGQDGVLGDDGRIFTSRNATAEPLYGIAATTQSFISTPGNVQTADLNVTGELKKSVDLAPFNVDPNTQAQNPLYDAADADDIIYGGLGSDFLHGGAGDDAISGAEALPIYYDNPANRGNVLGYSQATGEFAAYNEYDPRGKVMVDASGHFVTDGSGADFLLNFDQNEGPHPSLGGTVDASVYTDGNDKIFGDLGNDWLVGGTGRDDLYGGWGDDLLNADDDHSTGGNLNTTPDTNWSYEDRAFGGAGRDVLIANTGGDRLIDWAGEFNSYIVPFAPFGLGTVSRALQPQIADFLYALSASDGADATRAADTGAAVARNGEPEGELGLIRQQDAAWQDQTGAPNDPQPGNIPGGRRDVLRAADFNSGTAQGFAADSGTWNVQGGALQVSAESLGGDAVAVYQLEDALPGYFEVRASITVIKPTGGWNANSYIVFDYQSKNDFKFAGLDVSLSKLVMGHRDASGWHVDEQSPVKGGLKSGSSYNLLLAVNGTNATLLVDNKDVFTHTYAPRVIDDWAFGLNNGLVGVGSNNSRGSFDNIAVQVLPPQITFSETETFDDGVADRFTAGDTGSWTAGGAVYTAAAGAGTSLIDLGVASLNVGSLLDMTATLNTGGRAGFVFDSYGADNFKFAALDAASDQLLIGHYTKKSGWVVDASFNKAIDAGVDYTLNMTLKGTTVGLTLTSPNKSQVSIGYAFNAATVDGAFGLLSAGSASVFDNFTVKTDDPAFTV